MIFNRELVFQSGERAGCKAKLVRGTLIRFIPRGNTLSIYLPNGHGGFTPTVFVEGRHKDDKLLLGKPGAPQNIVSAVVELESEGIELNVVKKTIFGEDDIIYEVTHVPRLDA